MTSSQGLEMAFSGLQGEIRRRASEPQASGQLRSRQRPCQSHTAAGLTAPQVRDRFAIARLGRAWQGESRSCMDPTGAISVKELAFWL